MQAGSITCTSQRFALTRCHCSSQEKKARLRKSKEDRRAMVETFITNYQNTNNGSFPSLRLTQKEVGGSFYTVREIVRDIIQENRILGPGDLDMQSLTLEDAPIQPEICENSHINTGTELQFKTGNEENDILAQVNQDSDETLELLENNSFENGVLNLDVSKERNLEQMEGLNYKKCSFIDEEVSINNTGIKPTDDVLGSDFDGNGDTQSSLRNMISESVDATKIETDKGEIGYISEADVTLPSNEVINVDSFMEHEETSDSSGGLEWSRSAESGYIQETVMEERMETVDESESDNNEVKGEVLESNEKFSDDTKSEKFGSFLRPMDLNIGLELPISVINEELQESVAETIEKSSSEIKEGIGEILQSNGKKSLNESKPASNIGLAEGTGPDGRFEMVRAVVEVEQFPLPRANSSLNSEDDCVSASAGAEEKEMELLEVKAPAAIMNTEIKPEFKDLSSGESLDEVQKTEHGATMNDVTKTKGNRESAKKNRVQADNNPLWNTIRAFVTAIIKFWSE
ncbi:DNA binding protein [Rhynchospora pubera]|uniref:DNA binding protein n=1 Tax=Rhynchospora pubera TaxID=906938 RepID=A0AAV8EI26_9POAL|nr:DNA binding protein [Rhynchospora pubera]